MKKQTYTDEYFINRGYEKWDRYNLQPDIVMCNFQKRFDDEVGKKYFIDVQKISHDWMPDHLKSTDSYTLYEYTYSCQVYKKDTHAALNMEFFSDWSIEQVEEFIERLFQNGELDYYERWDEQ